MNRGRASLLVVPLSLLGAWSCASPAPRLVAEPAPASLAAAPSALASPSSTMPPATAASPCRALPRLAALPTLSRGEPPGPAHMPGLVSGLTSDAPAPMIAACDELAKKRRESARTRPGFRPRDPIPASQRRGPCYGDARGAWALDVGPFRPTTARGEPEHEAKWALLFVTPRGELMRSPVAQGTLSVSPSSHGSDVAIVGLADFDGDGIGEVLVGVARWSVASEGQHEGSAWALRAGVITPLDDAFAVGFQDVDGDGRIDRLRRGPPGDETVPLVDHALEGGRFSSDDRVAQAAWRRLCPAPPRGQLDSPRAVTCALVWGHDRAEIAQRIEEAKLPDECRRVQLAVLDAKGAGPVLLGACPSDEPPVPRDEIAVARTGCP